MCITAYLCRSIYENVWLLLVRKGWDHSVDEFAFFGARTFVNAKMFSSHRLGLVWWPCFTVTCMCFSANRVCMFSCYTIVSLKSGGIILTSSMAKSPSGKHNVPSCVTVGNVTCSWQSVARCQTSLKPCYDNRERKNSPRIEVLQNYWDPQTCSKFRNKKLIICQGTEKKNVFWIYSCNSPLVLHGSVIQARDFVCNYPHYLVYHKSPESAYFMQLCWVAPLLDLWPLPSVLLLKASFGFASQMWDRLPHFSQFKWQRELHGSIFVLH